MEEKTSVNAAIEKLDASEVTHHPFMMRDEGILSFLAGSVRRKGV
jgi:hypothetical protein